MSQESISGDILICHGGKSGHLFLVNQVKEGAEGSVVNKTTAYNKELSGPKCQ